MIERHTWDMIFCHVLDASGEQGTGREGRVRLGGGVSFAMLYFNKNKSKTCRWKLFFWESQHWKVIMIIGHFSKGECLGFMRALPGNPRFSECELCSVTRLPLTSWALPVYSVEEFPFNFLFFYKELLFSKWLKRHLFIFPLHNTLLTNIIHDHDLFDYFLTSYCIFIF